MAQTLYQNDFSQFANQLNQLNLKQLKRWQLFPLVINSLLVHSLLFGQQQEKT